MALAVQGQFTAQNVNGSTAIVANSTITADMLVGDTAFVVVTADATAGIFASCADNSANAGTANTWTQDAVLQVSSTRKTWVFRSNLTRSITVAGSHVVTVTFTSTLSFKSSVGFSTRGWTAVAAVDKTATATGTASPMSTGTTAATTKADEFVLAAYGGNATSTGITITDTSGMTKGANSVAASSGTGSLAAYAWKETSVTGTQAGSETYSFAGGGTMTQWGGIILTYPVVGGTNFTQSISGALSFHGSTPTKQVQRKLPEGALSFSGSVAKKQNARLLTASFTPTGALSRVQALGRQLTAAAFRPVGAITDRSITRTFTAGFTPTGALTSLKAFGKSLSAALSFVGSQSHVPAKVLTAAYAPTGALTEGKTLGRTFTALFSATTRTDVGIIIPAYSYPSPTTVWDGWISGAPNVKYMIADPGSPGGPGTFQDSNYVAAIAHAQANGIRILGYVDTSFGTVDPLVAEGQVDSWLSLYGITDIFFDNVNSGASFLSYYQALGDYVHATGGAKVVFNPGTNPDEGYFNGMADIINTFEGSGVDYASYSPPSFIEKYPSSMVSHLVYDVPDAVSMDAVVSGAIRDNAGFVYVTDATLAAFPWATVPAYWAQELAIPYTGFTKNIARKLTAAFTPHGQVASSRRGVMAAALSFSGSLSHGQPNRVFTAALSFSGSLTKQTFRTLFASLQASGVLHSHYIPPIGPQPKGGGGYGGPMPDSFFTRYKPTLRRQR